MRFLWRLRLSQKPLQSLLPPKHLPLRNRNQKQSLLLKHHPQVKELAGLSQLFRAASLQKVYLVVSSAPSLLVPLVMHSTKPSKTVRVQKLPTRL
jgi:hypothetical protein